MLEAELLGIEKELPEADKVKTFDVRFINEVLAITRDIIKNYDKADIDRKRIYLKFFIRKFIVHDKNTIIKRLLRLNTNQP